MANQPVIMPKLGVYTEDVLLLEWLVEEGAAVAAGDLLFVLETDKTTAEVEAEASGRVHRLVEAGEKVPIGTRVAVIAPTAEAYDAILATRVDAPGEPAGAPDNGRSGGAASVPPAAPAEPGPSADPTGPPVSPRARVLLRELGFTLEDARGITGSGPGGRIVDRDVAAWAEARRAGPGAAGALTVAGRVPLRGRRGTIAERMVSSLHTAAQLTSVLELDVLPLVELRERSGGEVGVTAVFVKLAAAALCEHPLLNARVTETDIELLAEVNVAVAVDTAEGIVAPVVHGADRLPLVEVDARIAELAERARANALRPADVDGATFTVSNGGIHPVDLTTAIIAPPQTGILWIGRIRPRPVVLASGEIAARPTVQACLTYDHRAVDGGPAAAFLATLQALVVRLPDSLDDRA